MVVFHPVQAMKGTNEKPSAVTDEQGRFKLTTLKPNDGAPEGAYAVTVELRDLVLVAGEPIRNGRNLLPPKFADAKTTSLRYTVGPGANDAVMFELVK